MSVELDDLFAGSGDPVAPVAKAAKPAKAPKAAKPAPIAAAPAGVMGPPEVAEPTVEEAQAPAVKKTTTMAVIWIDEDGSNTNYVTASRNGKTWQIKRGEEVTVPMMVIDILNNAKADRVVFAPDGSRKFLPYHTVPYRVLRFVEV